MTTVDSTIKRRAVNPAQKKVRIEAILSATESRFLQAEFSDIRLVDIASDIGISKAALYRYFRNKELLFLALFQQKLSQLAKDIEKQLLTKNIVDALHNAICASPTYCKLSGILHTILERNLTEEEAREFKLELKTNTAEIVKPLSTVLNITEEMTLQRFFMVHQIIIGCWASCNPSDIVKKVIEKNPELNMFNLSFEDMLKQQLLILLQSASAH